ncbi:hypothetical protein AC1031_012925 [Aphanomyces cochlioides]|nr:hypothetical protein AC1031_012925 [Aphanomyces cochlioides]
MQLHNPNDHVPHNHLSLQPMHPTCHSQRRKMQLPQTNQPMLHPRLQQPSRRPKPLCPSWWQATVSSRRVHQHARGGKWCLRHGGIAHKRYCSEAVFGKQAHANKKYIAHGGDKRCQVLGCSFHARMVGYCHHHTVDTNADSMCGIDQLIPDLVLDSTSCSLAWDDFAVNGLNVMAQDDESSIITSLP